MIYDDMYSKIYIPSHTNIGCFLSGILAGMIYQKRANNNIVKSKVEYIMT